MAETPPRRLRLKADGRIVEILSDGSECPLPVEEPMAITPSARLAALASAVGMSATPAAETKPRLAASEPDAAYARRIRAATKLTQAEFAARLGVPIETVRNWEQGKRSPRGPARALLKVIDNAPDLAFAILSPKPPI
ncbi:MAG: helix-turn-helix domain-containing protein [Rhizobiales bacterium]|nr:helix-turn-helix domain-containing protein [Hyphomicrobiales bacterium]